MGKKKLTELEFGKDYCLLLYSYQKVDEDTFFRHHLEDITFTSSGTIKMTLKNNTFYGYYSELPKTGIAFEVLKQYYSDKNGKIIDGNNYNLLKTINKENIDCFLCERSKYNDNLYMLYFSLEKSDTLKHDIGQTIYSSDFHPEMMISSESLNGIGINKSSICLTNDFNSDLELISSWFNTNILETPQSIKRKEEKKIMANNNNLFGNLRTGQAGSNYAITYFGGIAFKGKTYYNGKIFEADGLTFPFDMLYFIPATEVKKNDIIEKDGIAYHITDVDKSGTITAINLVNGKEETLIPGGPFGMSMYSKLFNPFGQMKGDNAFGNMMLMQAMFNGDGGSNNAMMMAMLMSQGGFQLPSFQMPAMPKAAEDK